MSDDTTRTTRRDDEPRYTLEELLSDPQRVGATRPAVAGAAAMAGEGRKTFTVPEMKRLVTQFRSREVES